MNQYRSDEEMAELLSSAIQRSQPPHKPAAAKKPYRLSSFGKKLIGGTVAVVLCLVLALIFILLRNPEGALKQRLLTYQETSGFTVYEPTKLPEGYSADIADVSMSGGLIFVTLKSAGADKPTITISQQALPGDITASTLYGLSAPEATDTKNGKLYIGSTDDTMNATLVTDDSWVLFSASKSLNSEVIKALASSLAPLR